MRRILIGFVGMVALLGSGGAWAVGSQINKEVRQKFPQFVRELCSSTFFFQGNGGNPLDIPFAQTQKEYHEYVNCLVNDAVNETVTELNREMLPVFRRLPSDFEPKEANLRVGNCSLRTAQAQQRSFGLKSLCTGPNEDSTVENFYSACRVTETLLAEFCGYQEYLQWKQLDDDSFFAENKTGDALVTNAEVFGASKTFQKQFNREIRDARTALYATLNFYKEFEQGYRTHLWLTAVLEGLRNTNNFLLTAREAIYSWPDKFINAASQICRQSCR